MFDEAGAAEPTTSEPLHDGLDPNLTQFREVKVRDLSRKTAEVLAAAASGERVIVTRHGEPIAVLIATEQAIDWFIASSEEFLRMRLEARTERGRGR
jgi:prevent-host-death family protein